MARVFLEKALEVTGLGQFELVNMAAKRAREIDRGSAPLVPRKYKQEKSVVTALREIEEGLYTIEHWEGKIKSAEEQALIDKQKEEEEYANQFTKGE